MKLTRTEILWTRNLLTREAESIRENIIEARKRNDPFTLLAVVQVESYESVAKKLDDLLEKRNVRNLRLSAATKRLEFPPISSIIEPSKELITCSEKRNQMSQSIIKG